MEWCCRWTRVRASAGLGAADLSWSHLSYCSLTWVSFSWRALAHNMFSCLLKRPLKWCCPWMPLSITVTLTVCAESSDRLFTILQSTVAFLPLGICGVSLSRLCKVRVCQEIQLSATFHTVTCEVILNQLFKAVFCSVCPEQEYTNLEKYKTYCLRKLQLPFCLNYWHSSSAPV